MRLLSSLIWLFVAGTTVPICSATMASGRSFAVHHVKSQKVLLESIPRGGAISFNPKLIDLKSFDLTSIDPKTVATVGLSCLAVHCAFDVLAPKTMVEFYGLDKYEKINSFYLSRIGGWGMVVATTLLLQLYSTIPSMKTIGYAFLPIAFITMFQLLTGKYDEVSGFLQYLERDRVSAVENLYLMLSTYHCPLLGGCQSEQWHCSCLLS